MAELSENTDIREVVPEGLSIGVNEMRALVQLAARQPAVGRYQIVIITDADRLTEGASNALLKAVEEPSDQTVFLLCAPSEHPDDVAATIRQVELLEAAGADLHERARQLFLALAERDPEHYLVLAARDPITDIAEQILDRVLRELAERAPSKKQAAPEEQAVSDPAGTLAP